MHGDLSDRNILINPKTLEITGLIDWERANLAPAYFEWVVASLSNGHEPAWRFELLDFLRSVLRAECRQAISAGRPSDDDEVDETAVEALYKETLAAWNAFVNVERAAQGISDDCYWTFENELTEPPVYPEWE
jgi:aminoglycoside phosphotransferase (APT) family kinase protein